MAIEIVELPIKMVDLSIVCKRLPGRVPPALQVFSGYQQGTGRHPPMVHHRIPGKLAEVFKIRSSF